ncbi:MAG: hypothetical protein P8J74_02975 [Woeseiaceae bacterium]|nr:hypothetical protein [Woeseiaceae bacterium]
MTKKKSTWAHMQIMLIALVFFGPLIIATWMYYGGHFQPKKETNYGAILEPAVNIIEELPNIQVIKSGFWMLIYSNESECLENCQTSLYTIRQSQKMLSEKIPNLMRVFLHGESLPDTVFLADELIGLIVMQNFSFSTLLNNKKPASLSAGGYFLIDPLGNLVMYHEPETGPSDIVKDIKNLLKSYLA